MTTYQIMRWDAVIPGNYTFPFPMIYIKPDANFLKHLDDNFNLNVTIKNSKSTYDGKKILGVVDTSKNYPNYRPTFFSQTEYFVITLFSSWDGYPSENGDIYIN